MCRQRSCLRACAGAPVPGHLLLVSSWEVHTADVLTCQGGMADQEFSDGKNRAFLLPGSPTPSPKPTEGAHPAGGGTLRLPSSVLKIKQTAATRGSISQLRHRDGCQGEHRSTETSKHHRGQPLRPTIEANHRGHRQPLTRKKSHHPHDIPC